MTRNGMLAPVLVGVLVVIAFGARLGGAADLTEVAALCTPVIDRSDAPLRDAAGGIVSHRGRHDCHAPALATIEPAAAPIAPARPMTGVIYFDLDHATPNPAGAVTLEAIIEAIKGSELGVVAVAGYTDTSGTAGYNRQLSLRRAQTVAAALIRAGVPAPIISTEGHGQTALAVPSPDDVALAANRRVVIELAP